MSEAAEPRARYSMGQAAELCASHPQTLRMYERTGLVCPSRSRGGLRLYTDEDIARIRRIQSYTELGVNLAGVEIIFRLLERVEVLEARLAERPPEAVAEREQTDALRRRLRREGSER